IQNGAQIVVGTPGRVLDHLRRGTLDPSQIRILVLDEADEMLSMGFAKELHAIVETLPKERQGLYFSATIPPDIERMATSHLRDPEFVTLSSDQVGAQEVTHYVYFATSNKRNDLVRVIEVEDPESAVVFCNTKDETERVAEVLQNKGYDADWLNGDLPQSDRERVMQKTREGKLRFLVATDVAARGIDISHLTHVINADFPESAEQYVHRTGRTGRAGRTGTAISMIGPKDIGALYILRLTYKIRPIEKRVPSATELRTRAEHDLVSIFVEAFGKAAPDPDDLALARRLLTLENSEPIVAGLLRAHLGARESMGEKPAQDAADTRRARNPKPVNDVAAPREEARAARPPEEARAPRSLEEARAPRRGPRRRERERAPLPEAFPLAEAGTAVDDDLPGFREDSDVRPVPQSPPRHDTDPPTPARGERRAPERAADEEFQQVFVNVGKRDGAREEELREWLRDAGIAEADLGRIRIRDRNTFVSVKAGFVSAAVAALVGKSLGGRAVVAELARPR
ncbi:MAG: DEAD/DEAH box helicase, partial [Polyangiaceae bacterium]